MKTFFKTYGKYAIGFLLITTILYLWQDRGRWEDNYTAMLAANKVKDKMLKDEKDRANFYADQNAMLITKIHDKNMEIDLTEAASKKYQAEAKSAQAKIKEMQDCEAARIALDFELTGCITKVGVITNEFVLQIDDLNLSWGNLVRSKDTEIGELVINKVDLVERVSVLTGQMVKFKAERGRQRLFWFFVGLGGGLLVASL